MVKNYFLRTALFTNSRYFFKWILLLFGKSLTRFTKKLNKKTTFQLSVSTLLSKKRFIYRKLETDIQNKSIELLPLPFKISIFKKNAVFSFLF